MPTASAMSTPRKSCTARPASVKRTATAIPRGDFKAQSMV
jgi:hypothetical protein